MDKGKVLERIESGSLRFDENQDGKRIHVEVEAVDSLGLLVRRVSVESDAQCANVRQKLEEQSAGVVDRLEFLDELKVIEVDGISNAVQIRSRKPAEEGFNEVILRGGRFIGFERHGAALHISKKKFERLVQELSGLV